MYMDIERYRRDRSICRLMAHLSECTVRKLLLDCLVLSAQVVGSYHQSLAKPNKAAYATAHAELRLKSEGFKLITLAC